MSSSKPKRAGPVLGWWFTESDRLPNGDGRPVVVGEKLTVDCTPVCCHAGLHASRKVLDALKYAPGAVLYRVRLSGRIDTQNDKLCATERTALWRLDATNVLREFVAVVARDALLAERKAGREPHPASWRAVEVALLYARGKSTVEKLEAAAWAAWAAAWAARAAAWAARAAAEARAAWAAARAAWAAEAWAAWAAARAARAAAWEAAWEAARRHNAKLTAMVFAAHRRQCDGQILPAVRVTKEDT